MTELSNVKLTISLKDTELNEEELDELTRNLRQQMNEVMQNLDEVGQVDFVAVEKVPEGSKALGGFLLGMLQAEVSLANVKNLLGFVGDRLSGKPIEMEVEANGRKLKVKASSKQELLVAIQAAKDFVGEA